MRQFFVILLMILICVGVSAQLEINIYTMTTKAHKNQIKIGGGFGSVPYEVSGDGMLNYSMNIRWWKICQVLCL